LLTSLGVGEGLLDLCHRAWVVSFIQLTNLGL